MKVLIAEDDPYDRELLRRHLERRGYDVTEAESGMEAWERLQSEHFPLVITDWRMPDMDGLALCRAIRERQEAEYVYVILLTACVERGERLAAMQAGADDYLTKPLDADHLAARLEAAQRILAMQATLAESNAFLAFANQRFAGLFQGLPVACVTYDAQGVIQDWNRAAEQLFGLRAEQVVQRRLWETIESKGQRAAIRERIARVFGAEHFENVEWAYAHPDGGTRHLLCSTFPLRARDQSVLGAISTHVDISPRKALEQQLQMQFQLSLDLNAALEAKQQELEQANAQLARLSTTDALTGLSNLRHFHEALQDNFALAFRHRLPLSLIMLDVDCFKQYNDAFGHPAGDDVLRRVAALLQASVRREDFVARYGGEEFVVLLPSTEREGAQDVAARLQAVVAEQQWLRRPVTISLGISTRTPAYGSASEMVDEADRALYASKQQGRNRWTHHLALPVSAAPSGLLLSALAA